MTASKLKELRKELDYTQEDFAIFASMRAKTYRRAEWGQGVSYTTAKKILDSINVLRGNRKMECLSLEDLGLHIV